MDTRNVMTDYWKEHSKEPTVKEMMLDSHAEDIGKLEHPEIVSMLPDLKDKDVIELGAGIGRFTGNLAQEAKSVLAVDFMESFLNKNREIHSNFKNISFQQGDVTQLKFEPNSTDFVFSNWLLMYLDDEEVRSLLYRILISLREGGTFFFRESCFHQSGDVKRSNNPTFYRNPSTYGSLMQSVIQQSAEGNEAFGYDIVFSKSVQAYVQLKGNSNQICWLIQKVRVSPTDNHGYRTFQEFLDTQQYSQNGILRYEKIFGRTFVSTGGRETTEKFVEMLDLKKGDHVLDVGCGIGGSAFYMAEKYNVRVTGIDLSSNMISIAYERASELKNYDTRSLIQFEIGDITKRNFPEASFDVIYSRDCILHIKGKDALFRDFLKWLKPGGRLLITDYCCKDGPHSPEYAAYVEQRHYHVLSPQKYGELLSNVGFVNVRAEDRTEQFVQVLQTELVRIKSIENEFTKEFSREDYDHLVEGWHDKLHRCDAGDQRWGLFYAEKSLGQ